MRPLLPTLGGLVAFALACGGDDTTAALPAGAPAPAAVAPAPDPLKGLSLAEICGDSGLALIKFDYQALSSDFAGTCCGPGGMPEDEGLCQMDFPFNDVPECSAYAYIRNSIYARYGYPFDKQEWVTAFGNMPWYTRRADFQEAWLSDTARANVARLQQLEKDKVGCAP